MLTRFINLALLVLISLLTLTGSYGIFWTLNGWLMQLHRIAAWGLIALIPWKVGISWRSLKRGLRPNIDRGLLIGLSLLMTVAAFAVLIFGVMWAWRLEPEVLWLRQTIISWHWMIALGMLVPLIIHVWQRWPRPREEEFTSRRGALRLLGIGGAGIAGWLLSAAFSEAREDTEQRVTGSRFAGKYSGNDFPITGEYAQGIDLASWRLDVRGDVDSPYTLDYEELLALPRRQWVATLDCTTGWYSTQSFEGVPLIELLAAAGMSADARQVNLVSATRYAQIFPLNEVNHVLIATHVGGEPLTHWHGFPVRAVAPFRRGWFWVKWLSTIEVRAGPLS